MDASTVPLRSRQFSLVEKIPKSVVRPGSAVAQRKAAMMRNPFFNRGWAGAFLIFIIIVFRNGHIANVQQAALGDIWATGLQFIDSTERTGRTKQKDWWRQININRP